MTDERTKVKQKIVKLLTKTIENGASEQEALSAMQKASELMQIYSVDITELQIKNTRSTVTELNVTKYNKHYIADSCLVRISKLCDLLVWRSSNVHGESCYKLYGFKEDLEIAEYLHTLIVRCILKDVETFKTSEDYRNPHLSKVVAVRSFIQGMETSFNSRLNQMLEEKNINLGLHNTGNSLVLLKSDQIRSEFEKEFPNLNIGFTKVKAKAVYSSAYKRGLALASSVQLNKGIRQDEDQKRLA